MRVLVTGGAGFIGSHLVEAMLDDGHDVRVVDNFATGRRENLLALEPHFELIEGDIRSYEHVHRAVRDCEIVFHQAAMPSILRSVQDPLTSHATNVVGTLNVLLAARDSGVRRVIVASSSSVYGDSDVIPLHESQTPMPISPYAVSKLAAESYCRSFYLVYGLETTVLRYFNVFGPRQDSRSRYAAVIPRFLDAALANRRPVIYGDGTQTRDFTYVSNVIDANRLAISSSSASGEVMNVAYGADIALGEVVEVIGDLTDRELQPCYEPARPGEVLRSVACIERARAVLGYEPAVSFREGLEQMLRSFEQTRLTPQAA